jgi:hypothetical protein
VKPGAAVTAAGDVEAGLRDQVGQAADRVVLHRIAGERADQAVGDAVARWTEVGDQQPPARSEHSVGLAQRDGPIVRGQVVDRHVTPFCMRSPARNAEYGRGIGRGGRRARPFWTRRIDARNRHQCEPSGG